MSLLPLRLPAFTLTPQLGRPLSPDSRPHPRSRCRYCCCCCCCRGQACPRPRARGLRGHGGGGRGWRWAGAWHCRVGCGRRTCGRRGQHRPSGEAPVHRLLGPPRPSAGGSGRRWAPEGCSREVTGALPRSGRLPTPPHLLPRAAHGFVEVSSCLLEQSDHLCVFVDDSHVEWGVA